MRFLYTNLSISYDQTLFFSTLVCKQSKNDPLKHKNIHTKLKLFHLVCFQHKKSRKLRKIYIPKCIFSIWYVKTKKTWQLYKFTTLVLKITLNS